MRKLILILALLAIVEIASAATPVTNFSASFTTGTVPLSVTFTDSSSNSPTAWAYYFGDENWAAVGNSQQTASALWTPRSGDASTVLQNGTLVIIAGYTGSFNASVLKSTDHGATWSLVTNTPGFSPRYGCQAVTLNTGEIVMTGGTNATQQTHDSWMSSDGGATWVKQSEAGAWAVRANHNMVVLPDNSILLFGGVNGGTKYNDVYRSADKGITWSQQTAAAGWSVRYHGDATVTADGTVVYAGGFDDSSYMNDVWTSTTLGATWVQKTSGAAWSKRFGNWIRYVPDGSLLTGGGNSGVDYNNDVYRSTDTGATWTKIANVTAMSGRQDAAVYMEPSGQLIFAGGYRSGWLNDVYKYNSNAGSSSQSPSHTFSNVGTYYVNLISSNANGWNMTMPKLHTITVNAVGGGGGGSSGGANFTPIADSGYPPRTVAFTDTSINLPNHWTWFFGDENYNANSWVQQSADGGWEKRAGHGQYTNPDGSITMFFGNDYGVHAEYDIWRTVNDGATWTAINTSHFTAARYSMATAQLSDGTIVFAGGYCADSFNANDVWKSSDMGYTWTILQANGAGTWGVRNAHVMTALPNNTLILTGGWNGAVELNDIWKSPDGGTTWTQVSAAAAFSKRSKPALVTEVDGSLVLMGGYNSTSGGTFMNDVWRSTDGGTDWYQVASSSSWSPRYCPAVTVMPDGTLILIGGYASGGATNDVWKSTDYGNTWTQLANFPSIVYDNRQSLSHDGGIVLTGGHRPDDSTATNKLSLAGSTSQNPSHQFTVARNYPVSLMAWNATSFNVTVYRSHWVNITGGTVPSSWEYTVPGDYQWTCPDNVTSVYAKVAGAGGSGKGAWNDVGTYVRGDGGFAGSSYTFVSIPVNPGSQYTVHVGTGGVTSVADGVSHAGGYSSFISNTQNGGAGALTDLYNVGDGAAGQNGGITGGSNAVAGGDALTYHGGAAGTGEGAGGGGGAGAGTTGGSGGAGGDGYVGIFSSSGGSSNSPQFTATPTNGAVGTVVGFTDQSTIVDNSNLAYNWSFGDGQYSNVIGNVTHVYQFIGTYSPSLAITSGSGTITNTKTGYISIVSVPISFAAPRTVSFTFEDAAGNPLDAMTVTCLPINTTMPSNWIQTYYGFSSGVNLIGTGFYGNTGTDGSFAAPFSASILYNFSLSKAGMQTYYLNMYPVKDDYLIKIPVGGFVVPTPAGNYIFASLTNTTINATADNFNVAYRDLSGGSLSMTMTIVNQTGASLYTSTWSGFGQNWVNASIPIVHNTGDTVTERISAVQSQIGFVNKSSTVSYFATTPVGLASFPAWVSQWIAIGLLVLMTAGFSVLSKRFAMVIMPVITFFMMVYLRWVTPTMGSVAAIGSLGVVFTLGVIIYMRDSASGGQ